MVACDKLSVNAMTMPMTLKTSRPFVVTELPAGVPLELASAAERPTQAHQATTAEGASR